MPKVFVCESGPMGGVSIVFVCGSTADALRWTGTMIESGREFEIYERQDDLIDFPAP